LLNRILITGASGGLGAALAQHYAAPAITLLLWGRDEGRLEAVARRCRRFGAHVMTRSLDLANSDAATAAIEEEETLGPIDLAIFAAGLGDIRSPTGCCSPSSHLPIGVARCA
jgi:short-subunit dehydrogenase